MRLKPGWRKLNFHGEDRWVSPDGDVWFHCPDEAIEPMGELPHAAIVDAAMHALKNLGYSLVTSEETEVLIAANAWHDAWVKMEEATNDEGLTEAMPEVYAAQDTLLGAVKRAREGT